MAVPAKTLRSGISIPVYGLGTWRIGDDRRRRAADITAVRDAVDAGVTHIDTAESYGNGQTELLLREALTPYPRRDLFIASKVSPQHARPEQVVTACESSLERLGTGYLDLYMLHARNSGVPLEETADALDRLVDAGKVRRLGVSNFNVASLAEIRQVGRHPVIANQVHYSLTARAAEQQGLLGYCRENDVFLSAWRPVMQSRLDSGPSVVDAGGSLISRIANKYEKTPIQIALNWLISQTNVVVLCKTSNAAHLAENLGTLGWSLEQDDVELLRRDFPNQTTTDTALA